MKEKITVNIKNIRELENLYRSNPDEFTVSFNEIYNSITEEPLARFWFTRLNFNAEAEEKTITEISQPGSITANKNFGIWFTIIASLIAGTIAKLPQWMQLPMPLGMENVFPFIIFPLMALFFFLKNKIDNKNIIKLFIIVIVSAVFINLIPGGERIDTHILTTIHLTLLMWVLWGAAFIGLDFSSTDKKIMFYKRNGDMIILSGVILCGGVFLTGLTFGLFAMIKVNISRFYLEYVVVYGVTATPFVANYMIENTPAIINKVAPFIAKIFTPLVLLLMTGFLIALAFFSKDPFNNRDELITYNILLIVILAIIVFAFTGQKHEAKSFYNKMIIALVAEAVIINIIAVSAIIYRLISLGITPNRAAVFGGNVLMFINLIIISIALLKYIRNRTGEPELNKSFTLMLPYYTAWLVFVSFIFPFIFWFK